MPLDIYHHHGKGKHGYVCLNSLHFKLHLLMKALRKIVLAYSWKSAYGYLAFTDGLKLLFLNVLFLPAVCALHYIQPFLITRNTK